MAIQDIVAAADATLAASKQKSLELLFDYTKFHIGVYLTLTASYLTAATANVGGKWLLNLNQKCLWPDRVLHVGRSGRGRNREQPHANGWCEQ